MKTKSVMYSRFQTVIRRASNLKVILIIRQNYYHHPKAKLTPLSN